MWMDGSEMRVLFDIDNGIVNGSEWKSLIFSV